MWSLWKCPTVDLVVSIVAWVGHRPFARLLEQFLRAALARQRQPLQAVPGARAVSIRQECAWVEAHTQNLVLLLQAVPAGL